MDDLKEIAEAELEFVHGGAPPAQGSGKNEGDHKVDVFAGNPHAAPARTPSKHRSFDREGSRASCEEARPPASTT